MHNLDSRQKTASKMAEVLADLNVMSTITHGFHWNVMGSDFSEYHDFFGAIYEDIAESIDPAAEQIRKLGFATPYMMQDFLSLTSVNVGRVRSSSPQVMLEQLLEINAQVISCLYGAFATAEECNEQGVMDFLVGRIDAHNTWQWQIAASLGMNVNELPSMQQEDMPVSVHMMEDVPVVVDMDVVDEYADLPDFAVIEED